MKTPLHRSPSSRSRGVTLAAYVVLLPFALFFFLLMMSRIEIANIATKQHERRVQARLLAESALAAVRVQIESGKFDFLRLPGGSIEGAGSYWIEGSPSTPGAFKAIGSTLAQTVRGDFHVIAEIDFRLTEPAAGLKARIATESLRFRIEPAEG